MKTVATEYSSLFTFFGGTGDLAKRKLYPSLFKLYVRGNLGEHFAVIGTARDTWTDEKFREIVTQSIQADQPDADMHAAEIFVSHFYYIAHDVTDKAHYAVMKDLVEKLDKQYSINGNRIFYLSMAPRFFGEVALNLKSEGLLSDNGTSRLVIEKPFGTDYTTAETLNDQLSGAFDEKQIYRIDHYLGKEMVQNIQALRFGNTFVESLWNNRYIDNVQVTLSEKLGVEDRAGYYDTAGALRDMVQNHIMQIVSQLAMEQPVSFTDADVRVEKIKALRSLRVYSPAEAAKNFIRGQYGANDSEPAYRDEPNVPKDSHNDTFVAGKLLFDNYRWSGVPFYVRTGKRLADKFTRIDVVFKKPLIDIFAFPQNRDNSLAPNVLTIYVEPNSGFSLQLNAKTAGQGFETEPIHLDFQQDVAQKEETPEPYERLLHDTLKGDQTNFASWDEVSYAWKFVDVIQKLWDTESPDFPNYVSGSMGPAASDELLQRDHRAWVYRLNR